MDCSLPGSSVHEIFQARILEWVAISFSGGSSWPRVRTRISCIGRWILYHWATREAHISTRRPFWEETGPAVGCLSLRQIITHTGSRCHTKEQKWPLYSGAGDSRGDWRGNFAAGSCYMDTCAEIPQLRVFSEMEPKARKMIRCRRHLRRQWGQGWWHLRILWYLALGQLKPHLVLSLLSSKVGVPPPLPSFGIPSTSASLMSLLNWPAEKPNWFRASGSDSPTPGAGWVCELVLRRTGGCVWLWVAEVGWALAALGVAAGGGGGVFISGWGGLGLGLARGGVSVWVCLCLCERVFVFVCFSPRVVHSSGQGLSLPVGDGDGRRSEVRVAGVGWSRVLEAWPGWLLWG